MTIPLHDNLPDIDTEAPPDMVDLDVLQYVSDHLSFDGVARIFNMASGEVKSSLQRCADFIGSFLASFES